MEGLSWGNGGISDFRTSGPHGLDTSYQYV